MRLEISRRLVIAQVLFLSLLISNNAFLCCAVAQDAGKTHLYFITNDGCAPCRQVEPAIEALKREGYPVTTVNYDANRQWANQLGVNRTPTVVMISNNKMVGRHAGLIDGVTLKKWFAGEGVQAGSAFSNLAGNNGSPGGTKVVLPNEGAARPGQARSAVDSGSSTMHKGTRRPGTAQEQLALQATVRLKVEDPAGTSYATGTVIHSQQGECLVVTCGHVFRDAKGTGKITAEYGFDKSVQKTAAGELIYYDSDARDIGLVAIKTDETISPVSIASRESSIERGLDIFSIGCDHGESPTIRHSRIKNQASYDGAIKYDIFGRPVDGRSGGGLFTEAGELIGVCNAAAVEVDEGIYTALDTIYWQIARVNLDHLFNGQRVAAASPPPRQAPVRMPVAGADTLTMSSAPLRNQGFVEVERPNPSATRLAPIPLAPRVASERTSVALDRDERDGDDKEVIILVRSKSNPGESETISIGNPTPILLEYLGSMDNGSQRQLEFARMRTDNEIQRR